MGQRFSLEELRTFFFDLETRHSVYSLEYRGVFYWKLIRMSLFSHILKCLGMVEESHPMTSKAKAERLVRLVKYSGLNILRKRKIQKCDILILTSGRKYYFNGDFVDVYLYDQIQYLSKNEVSHLIVDRPDHYGRHLGAKLENLVYFEGIRHLVREYPLPFLLPSLKDSVLEEISEEIKRELGIECDVKLLAERRLFRFSMEKKYFDNLLDKTKPKEVFLVCSYGKEELIASAHERAIRVTEVQHGVVSDYHMGYAFPQKIRIPYFPDRLILFGEYWRECIEYPHNTELEVGRFSYFRNSSTTNDIKHDERVLFISQGAYGKDVSRIAARFATQNKIECYYKLHPSEFHIWREEYDELVHCSQVGRIKVVAEEISLNDLFRHSKYVVGVNSTALFEALQFDCNVYVLELEGHQYMKHLLKGNHAKLISAEFTVEDLVEFQSMKVTNKEYFFIPL